MVLLFSVVCAKKLQQLVEDEEYNRIIE